MSDETEHTQDQPTSDDILAAELSLGLLSGHDLTQAERRARIDMGFAELVEDWDIRFAQLSDEIAPVEPPKGLFKKIAEEAYPDSPRRIWQQLGIIPSLLGAGAAALVLVLALNFGGVVQNNGPIANYRADIAAEDNSLVLAAAYVEGDGRLFVERQIGQRPPERDLELWVIIGDTAPISLGVLSSDETLDEITIPENLRDQMGGAVLAITDEPIGGSPSGSATGSILAVGEIIAL